MKPHQENVIVRSGIKFVHSFDLWGTMVIQEVMGPRVLDAYAALMAEADQDKVQQNIANYQAILRGDKAALANKKQFVDAVEDPLWKAFLKGEIDVPFNGAFYEDAIAVASDIVDAGEDICILTTGDSPWVPRALASISDKLGNKTVYSGDKSKPQAYEAAAMHLAGKGACMLSHTEDQLKGLAGILASDLKKSIKLVYVERANLATPDQVQATGIDYFVRDLREVPYTRL